MKSLIKIFLIALIVGMTSYLAYQYEKKDYHCRKSNTGIKMCFSENTQIENITSLSCVNAKCDLTKKISKVTISFMTNPTPTDICEKAKGSFDTIYSVEDSGTLAVDVCKLGDDFVDISMVNRFYLTRKW